MCGIVGYVGHRDVVPLLVHGLEKLEYRGYDSAGVVVVRDGELEAVKAEGKLERLKARFEDRPLLGSHGLGHTRQLQITTDRFGGDGGLMPVDPDVTAHRLHIRS